VILFYKDMTTMHQMHRLFTEEVWEWSRVCIIWIYLRMLYNLKRLFIVEEHYKGKGKVIPGLDRLCVLVVRVSGYRCRGPGFDSLRFQIFWEAVGLERGPLSLVRTTEELLEGKVAAPV
jgi:hypothetical protein